MQLQESNLQSVIISSNRFQKLRKIVQSSCVSQVDEVPQEYNENCLFELPPVQQGSQGDTKCMISLKGFEKLLQDELPQQSLWRPE